MNHYYDLSDNEARLAADGQLTEIRIPIEGLREGLTSAIEGKDEATDAPNGIWLFLPTCETVTCPYAIGDTIRGRETFLDNEDFPCSDYLDENISGEGRWLYRSDAPLDAETQEAIKWLEWQPASDMPDEAIRHEWTVTGVDVYKSFSLVDTPTVQWYWVITLETKP